MPWNAWFSESIDLYYFTFSASPLQSSEFMFPLMYDIFERLSHAWNKVSTKLGPCFDKFSSLLEKNIRTLFPSKSFGNSCYSKASAFIFFSYSLFLYSCFAFLFSIFILCRPIFTFCFLFPIEPSHFLR